MCGIAGIVRFDGATVDRKTLEDATDRLAHRGPDAAGTYIDNEGTPCVGLGHRRLSIIDLSFSANQPMSSESGDVRVVFNGEIYNFVKLRELLRHDHRFATNSDTEVIVHLYEQYGEDAIAMLDGMFAIAIYDRRQHKIILARDRVGKKPLYYYHDRTMLLFASEIKAILSMLPGQKIDINEQAIPFYLVYGYARPPHTFYRSIDGLEPSTYMVYKHTGEAETVTYWHLKDHILSSSADADRYPKDDSLLRLKLTDAVRKRLVSDVPLGVFLSGGIDSSIITGIMSRLTSAPVKTFSIGFSEDQHYDETGYANIVAKKYGTDHHVFIVTPRAIDLIDRLIYHYDAPFGDASAIPTYIVSNLTRQHVTVALNGDGGDEIFAGYTRFTAARLSEMIPAPLRSFLAGTVALFPDLGSGRSIPSRARRFLRALNMPLIRRYINWVSYVQPDSLNRLLNPSVYRGSDYEDTIPSYFTSHLKGMEETSVLTQLLYLNFKTYLPDDLLIKMDRMTMANGLEGRSPFLDTELVEYAFGIPDHLKLKGLQTKLDLRYTFRDILPGELMHRGKMGFGVPLGAWFRNKLKTYLEGHIIAGSPMINAYLNAGEIRRIFDEHQSMARDHGLALWLLLTLELWLRGTKDGKGKGQGL
ncbi:MAG: asparagine synthase (glutamine-hydrolyzing) [Deltaproteobacteria bacterium]|nr:asparagine synthase (glutamine-hydrolyzing) [Deltaproteobacteria bacterium]